MMINDLFSGHKGEPFLKWVGGKRRLAPTIVRKFPQEYGTYYEPFLGGAAVFLNAAYLQAQQPHESVLSDINQDLITTYTAVKDHTHRVAGVAMRHLERDSKEYFLSVRDKHPDDETEWAGLFIYLNNNCFKGMMKYGSGKLKVTYGYASSRPEHVQECILSAGEALQNATILRRPYYEVRPQKGDLVYLDPPYYNKLDDYTPEGFSQEDQRVLCQMAEYWRSRGVHVVASNSNDEFIRDLWSSWTIDTIECRQQVQGEETRADGGRELLIY